MEKSFNSIWRWFLKQGLNEEEFQYVVEDIFNFIEHRGKASLHLLNLELEVLGWGVQIMDEATYRRLLTLHQNKNHIDFTAHLSGRHQASSH
jgi:hypothetical protein